MGIEEALLEAGEPRGRFHPTWTEPSPKSKADKSQARWTSNGARGHRRWVGGRLGGVAWVGELVLES